MVVQGIIIDCEHGHISDDSMHNATAAIAAMGNPELVQVRAAGCTLMMIVYTLVLTLRQGIFRLNMTLNTIVGNRNGIICVHKEATATVCLE